MEDEEHLSNEEFEELGEVDPAFTNVSKREADTSMRVCLFM